MGSKELLEQEEAFHKLNAEIELRTRQLMKNVEAVMNKQCDSKNWPPNNFKLRHDNERNSEHYTLTESRSSIDLLDSEGLASYYDSGGTYRSPHSSGGRRVRSQCRNQKEQRKKDIPDSVLIPPCAKGMSAENLSRFLKAKGKLLQEDLEQTKRELQIKTDEYKKVQQELRTREEEKLKYTGEIGSLREKVKKLESSSSSLSEKLQMRDSENVLLKKEIDMLRQEIKKITLSTSGQEMKLNKVKEENEKLKQQIKQTELNEKETRDKYRMKNEEMLNSVRKLEKQKNELVTAIKKQVILIENLKKQKGLIETEGALNFTEKEFLKLLDSKFEEERR